MLLLNTADASILNCFQNACFIERFFYFIERDKNYCQTATWMSQLFVIEQYAVSILSAVLYTTPYINKGILF